MTERYSRQILFKAISEKGQSLISHKHVLIIGCGALGSVTSENLVRAGIGKLTIIDRDYVEISNLQRQYLYSEKDVADQMPKSVAAKKRLAAINSEVKIEALFLEATPISLIPLIHNVDVVIDATDNFDSSLMINDLFQKYRIPWVFGSCVGSTGMSFTVLPKESPCLRCLLHTIAISGGTCDLAGIISPAVQMVAAHQTVEALKLLVGDQKALRTKLVTFDIWNNHYQMINVERAKKSDCPTCGICPQYPSLQYNDPAKFDLLCGRDTVLVRAQRPAELEELAKRLKEIGRVKANDFLLSVEYQTYRVVFFKDGRTLVHGTDSIEKAKSIYYHLAE